MKNSKNSKTKMTITIATILILTFPLLITIIIQPSTAQLAEKQPYNGPLKTDDTAAITVETRAFLSFRPNPVGINQPFLVKERRMFLFTLERILFFPLSSI